MNLAKLKTLFAGAGCTRLYAKPLAKNDNSKQQVYFGSDFQALHLFPHGEILPDNDPNNSTLKATVDFGWLQNDGSVSPAPGAQFILYPQYPEVRFSGFLQGCRDRPSDLMSARVAERVLFLGVNNRQQMLAYVVGPDSSLAREFRGLLLEPTAGVFIELELPKVPSEEKSLDNLLAELRRIHAKGWIDSKQLSENGSIRPCNAPQCGGFTLEAELGIPKNSKAEPDFLGWEVKQHAVPNFDHLDASVITLLTPEPTGGYYGEHGVEAFVRRFGYEDKRGRADRLNFGGIHRVDHRHEATHMTMRLQGFDVAKSKFNPTGAIALVSDTGEVAAAWNFAGLLTHWTRKHAQAVYVPSQCRKEPKRQYSYGGRVRVAMQTDFLRLLKALANGTVYYDPGIKVEQVSTDKPTHKGRSQFRVVSRDINSLYRTVKLVTL